MYDTWLLEQANKYMTDCKPQQIEADSEYHSADYNCNYCDNTECENWTEYNELEAE